MYSLCQRNLQPERGSLTAIDKNTFFIAKRDGCLKIIRNGDVIYSTVSKKYAGCVPVLYPDADRRLNEANYVNGVAVYPNNGEVRDFALTIHDKSEEFSGATSELLSTRLIYEKSHIHVSQAPRLGGMFMFLVPGNPADNLDVQYTVFRRTIDDVQTVFIPEQNAIRAGEPLASTDACLFPYNSDNDTSIFAAAVNKRMTGFNIVIYRLHSELGWVPHAVDIGSAPFPFLGTGISAAVDRRNGHSIILLCFPTTSSTPKRTVRDLSRATWTLKVGGGFDYNYVDESTNVILIANPVFNYRTTYITTCPETGRAIVYRYDTGIFYTLNYQGNLEQLNFKKVSKQVIISIYKYLMRECGAITPCNKQVRFEASLSKPAVAYLKNNLGSPTAAGKLEVLISDKSPESGKIYVKLLNKDNGTSHEFPIPTEVWEKAFVRKDKKSKVDSVTPVLRLLRMMKGTKLKPEEEEKLIKSKYSVDSLYDTVTRLAADYRYQDKHIVQKARPKKRKRKKKTPLTITPG